MNLIKQNHYASMRRMILLIMVLVPIIPFILALCIGHFYFTKALETGTIESLKRIVGDHCHMLESFLEERKADLELVIGLYGFDELNDEKKLAEVFRQLRKQSNTFLDLGVFNSRGLHVQYQGPFKLTGKLYDNEQWFKAVMNKGIYISDIFLGFRKVPHFVIAVARDDGNERFVVRATIDTLRFNSLVEKVRIGKSGEAYLLNEKGILQTYRRSGGNLMDRLPENLGDDLFEKSAMVYTFIHEDATGKEYLYATTRLKNINWLLVVRQEKADSFAFLLHATRLIVLIILAGVAVITAMAFYLTNMIVNRMKEKDADRDQLHEQLIRAHRLAEIGEMAAGFAHEINNPLQIIKSEQSLVDMLFSDMKEKGCLSDCDEFNELRESMEQIKFQVNRCGEITQAILKFGRKSKPDIRDIDLRVFIPEVVGMIAKKASVHGIDLTQDISGNILPVCADAGQLQQVLINLFNNAMDAVIEKHGSQGGKLTIETEMKGKEEIIISVIDNGIGIKEDLQEKVFSPFFTTKPVGKGTGLGLSVCYGIIKSMGGDMSVRSEHESGATFMIRLPVVCKSTETASDVLDKT